MLGVSIPTALTFRATSCSAAAESIPGKCNSATAGGPVRVVPRYCARSGQRRAHPVRKSTIELAGIVPCSCSHLVIAAGPPCNRRSCRPRAVHPPRSPRLPAARSESGRWSTGLRRSESEHPGGSRRVLPRGTCWLRSSSRRVCAEPKLPPARRALPWASRWSRLRSHGKGLPRFP